MTVLSNILRLAVYINSTVYGVGLRGTTYELIREGDTLAWLLPLYMVESLIVFFVCVNHQSEWSQ